MQKATVCPPIRCEQLLLLGFRQTRSTAQRFPLPSSYTRYEAEARTCNNAECAFLVAFRSSAHRKRRTWALGHLRSEADEQSSSQTKELFRFSMPVGNRGRAKPLLRNTRRLNSPSFGAQPSAPNKPCSLSRVWGNIICMNS